jgi:hypothetical protein
MSALWGYMSNLKADERRHMLGKWVEKFEKKRRVVQVEIGA